MIGYPDGWNNTSYCNNAVTHAIDLYGTKVYWAARDLASSPVGNHHYLLYVPDNPGDFGEGLVDLGGGKNGFTQGGFNRNGKLKKKDNNNEDITAAKEYFDPENNTSWNQSDYDLEIHEIPRPQGMTDTEFIRKLQNEMNSYNDELPYSLDDNNCAALVNTVLKNAGIDENTRKQLGEFDGVDWGEEDIISDSYFE